MGPGRRQPHCSSCLILKIALRRLALSGSAPAPLSIHRNGVRRHYRRSHDSAGKLYNEVLPRGDATDYVSA
jgi:hypothetical protein